MIKRLLYIVFPLTIIVGSLLVALPIITGSTEFDYTVLSIHRIDYVAAGQAYSWYYYKLDIQSYLRNLQTSLNITQLNAVIPEKPVLKAAPEAWKVVEWLEYIANFLFVYLINWLIYIINWVFIVPIKILLYPFNILLAILGIQTSDIEWVKSIREIYELDIPLIPDFI